MKRNQGFTAVIPLLILGLGLVVAVLLVGRQTFFKPRASEPTPATSPWGQAVSFQNNLASESASLDVQEKLGIANPFTIEMWLKFSKPTQNFDARKYTVFSLNEYPGYQPNHGHIFELTQKVDNLNDRMSINFEELVYNSRSFNGVTPEYFSVSTEFTPYNLEFDKWYHVAIVSESLADNYTSYCQMRLFVNGKTHKVVQKFLGPKSSNYCQLFPVNVNTAKLTVAKPFGDGYSYFGYIDDLRISNTNRYFLDFSVPTVSFGLDSSTIALWHMDTKQCNATTGLCLTPDVSPNLLHAATVGSVQFVPSTVPFVSPNRPPVAKMIVGAPADMREPVKIKFMNASTDADGDAMTFLWNFGDGLISREASPTATFEVTQRPKPEKQTYNIKLTAFDSHGASSSATTSITVLANHNPKANFTIDQSNPDKVTVKFTNKSTDQDKDQLKYGWSFGDGTASTEISPIHSYPQLAEMKNYVVTLTADDSRGGVATKSATVKIANITHKACSGLTCTSVKGPGTDQCKTNTDCRNQ